MYVVIYKSCNQESRTVIFSFTSSSWRSIHVALYLSVQTYFQRKKLKCMYMIMVTLVLLLLLIADIHLLLWVRYGGTVICTSYCILIKMLYLWYWCTIQFSLGCPIPSSTYHTCAHRLAYKQASSNLALLLFAATYSVYSSSVGQSVCL